MLSLGKYWYWGEMLGSCSHLAIPDGGGVRGLSILLILQAMMERINPTSPPKPCEVFDLIGGTSTGGYVPNPTLKF